MSNLIDSSDTILDYISKHVQTIPTKTVFTFLANSTGDELSLTFKELEAKAKNIAAHLLTYVKPGDRVILCYPPGLDYIVAFYGCLYAGVVAVPVYPPQGKASIARFTTVMSNCQAGYILSSDELKKMFWSRLPDSYNLDKNQIILTDLLKEAPPQYIELPTPTQDSLAFFQYTSGSTGDPKIEGSILFYNIQIRSHLF